MRRARSPSSSSRGPQFGDFATFGRVGAAGKLVEISRRAEGIAPAQVIVLRRVGLPRKAGAIAPFSKSPSAAGIVSAGDRDVVGVNFVTANTDQELPVLHELDGILRKNGIAVAAIGIWRPGEFARRYIGRVAVPRLRRLQLAVLVQIFETGKKFVLHAEGVESGIDIALEGNVVDIGLARLGLRGQAVLSGRRPALRRCPV